MATLTIRNVPESVKLELRLAAARRGVSMEQEARDRLACASPQKQVQANVTEQDLLALGKAPDDRFSLKDVTDTMWNEGL